MELLIPVAEVLILEFIEKSSAKQLYERLACQVTPSAQRTFHPFKRLPVEIRLAIWRLSLPEPRVIEAYCSHHENHLVNLDTPPTGPCIMIQWHATPGGLHICKESRQEFLRAGYEVANIIQEGETYRGIENLRGKKMYVNLQIDTLHSGTTIGFRLSNNPPECNRNYGHLDIIKFQHRSFTFRFWRWASIAQKNFVWWYLTDHPELKTITVTSTGKNVYPKHCTLAQVPLRDREDQLFEGDYYFIARPEGNGGRLLTVELWSADKNGQRTLCTEEFPPGLERYTSRLKRTIRDFLSLHTKQDGEFPVFRFVSAKRAGAMFREYDKFSADVGIGTIHEDERYAWAQRVAKGGIDFEKDLDSDSE
jgi:hypothetical protein